LNDIHGSGNVVVTTSAEHEAGTSPLLCLVPPQLLQADEWKLEGRIDGCDK
jgi:hypothetical protein